MKKTWAGLERFIELQKQKLAENAHKGGWASALFPFLLGRACEEMVELLTTFETPADPPHASARDTFFLASHHLRLAANLLKSCNLKVVPSMDTGGEAADVANFMMMTADRSERAQPKACPHCDSTDFGPVRNYGRPQAGRFQCFKCERTWDTTEESRR